MNWRTVSETIMQGVVREHGFTERETALYLGTALAGEVGALCNLIKKATRDGDDHTAEILRECADVLAYTHLISRHYGGDLETSAQEKLAEVARRPNMAKFLPVKAP